MNPKQPESISEYLQEYAKLVVLEVDEKGIIRHANRHALKMAGRELAGRPFKDFFVEFTQLPDLDVIMEKGIQRQMLNVSGSRGLPQSIYFTSMRTADGFVLIGEIDYAELEELRSNMITMNNELNNLARELQKKNVELDRLNKLKNQFLGMAAHDLRNPIGSIMSFSDFILENRGEDISPDLKKIIDIIRTSSKYMLNLLEELLDVVKIESGKMELNYQETKLTDYLHKVVDINTIIAKNKDINIKLNTVVSSLLVSFDQLKIEQVLNNLISNAIKFSPPHTTITVGAFETDNEVIVSVQDQGQGIPKEEMHLLFEPFTKTSVRATGGEMGSGLGLSIVKKIIIGHMGRIWVDSKVGEGTTFYFSIPAERPHSG